MIKAAHMFNPGVAPLSDKTVGQILTETTAMWPDRVCLISNHQNLRLTFADLHRRVDAMAAGLRKLGLKSGDHLGICGPNNVEWIIANLSASRIGVINVNINPAYQQSELEYCLRKVNVRAVVSPFSFKSQNYSRMLLTAKETCPSLEHIVIISQDHVA